MLSPEEYKVIADKIVTVVGEHTENWIVIAEVPKDDGDGGTEIHTFTIWHGGINTCMGMCDRGKMRMQETARRHDFGMPERDDLEKE
jgi:hypothetical protein